MKDIEKEVDKTTLIRIARTLSTHVDPCVAGEEIVFKIAGIRPQSQDPPGMDVYVEPADPQAKRDVKYAMEIARRVIPEYDKVEVDSDFDEQGGTRVRLTR